jgi:ferritin-like protein
MLSRRELLTGGLAGAGGAVLATAPAAVADTQVTDGALLSYALQVEQTAVVVYEQVLAMPVLGRESRALLLEFLGHEREHVAALLSALQALGQAAPAPVSTARQARAVLAQHGLSVDFAKVHGLKDAITLLYDIEGLSQGAYYAAVGLLRSSRPLASAAQALACEAQHQALLTALLFPGEIKRSVPGAFVEGWQ